MITFSENIFFYILLPTYNRPKLVLRAVNSVLAQNSQSYKLIIFNDGSSTNYSELESLIKNNQNIEYIKNPVNIGINASRNQMLSLILRQASKQASKQAIVYYFTLSDDDYLTNNAFDTISTEAKKLGFPAWLCFNCQLGSQSEKIDNFNFNQYEILTYQTFRIKNCGDKHFVFNLFQCSNIRFPEKFYKNGYEEIYYFKIKKDIHIIPKTVKTIEYYQDGLTWYNIHSQSTRRTFKNIIKHILEDPKNINYYYWLVIKIFILYDIFRILIPKKYYCQIKKILFKIKLKNIV